MSFQLTSTLLDACVLGILSKEDAYGYVVTQTMKEKVGVSESTMYPVLRRLKKEGYLDTYDQSYQGRNRRYYTLTDLGRTTYVKYKEDWKLHRKKIDEIIGGNESNE